MSDERMSEERLVDLENTESYYETHILLSRLYEACREIRRAWADLDWAMAKLEGFRKRERHTRGRVAEK